MPTSSNKKSSKKSAPTQKNKHKGTNPLQTILASVCIGTAVFFAVSLIAAFVLSKTTDPDSLIIPASFFISVVCGMSCGICSYAISKEPFPQSLICGIVMVFVYLIISLFFDKADISSGMIFKTATVSVLPLSSVCGGMFLSKKNDKSKKKRL